MPSTLYHFNAKRPAEELILSEDHKLSGHVAQYLTNFQLEGIRFLFKHFKNNQSCILNDESGLGKTAMVCAFLESVLPHDSSRNCLIIVKNDEWIKNWKFHLDTLTRLSTKIIFMDKDVDKEIVYLTKWDSLHKSGSLANYDFDCIVIDNRGDLMANRICSGYLLRNYESKISLVVSTSDVAVDLRQFHTMLRLCGRLDKSLEDFKTFEDKFCLPKTWNSTGDSNMLEAYFLRREKLINFCRDFRMRRYRHQFEDELPLVQKDVYLNSLNAWAQKPHFNSSSSSSSVRILTSSSEKDAEQLLKSYFNPREELDLNIEISNITAKAERSNKLNNHGDLEHMSPLLFESDPEDREFERCLESRKKLSQHLPEKPGKEIIIPISIDTENNHENLKKEKQQCNLKDTPPLQHKRSTRSAAEVTQNKLPLGEKKESLSRSHIVRSKYKKSLKNYLPDRNLRSDHATRSKTLKSKYLIIDITDDDLLKRQKLRRNRRKRGNKLACMKPEKLDQNEKIGDKKEEPKNIKVGTRSSKKVLNNKIAGKPKKITKAKLEDDRTHNNASLNASGKHEKTRAKLNIEKSKAVIDTSSSKKRTTIKSTTSNKKKSDTELINSGDVHFVSPQDQIIVLSSSTDECTPPSRRIGMNKVLRNKSIRLSPDIFSNIVDESDISCSQKSKISNGLKTNSAIPKQDMLKNGGNLSCLDILENEFQKGKRNTIRETEEIFEISTSETFKNILQLNDHSSEVTPIRSRSVTFQKNKITKYLIGPEDLTPSLESNQSEVGEYRRNVDNYPKTPKRQRILQKSLSTSKRSPKATCPRDITPNSLTKWLIKSDSTKDTSKSKPSKRRRLDLWFSD